MNFDYFIKSQNTPKDLCLFILLQQYNIKTTATVYTFKATKMNLKKSLKINGNITTNKIILKQYL